MPKKKSRHPVDLEQEAIHALLNKILNPPIDKKAGKELLLRIPKLLETLDGYAPPLPTRARGKIEADLQKVLREARAIMSANG